MKIFHHNDNDGYCSAFWVLKKVKTEEQIKLYEMNYDEEFPFDEIKKDEEVYIVDYSIFPEEMTKLLEITSNVTWVDHHQSAIKRYKNYPYEIRGIRHDGLAACILTYCYLTQMTDGGKGNIKKFDYSMTYDAPRFTKLIADYDVWTFVYGDATKEFEIAMSTKNRKPTDEIWEDLYNDWDGSLVDDMQNDGAIMLEYRDSFAQSYCDSNSYECEFEGYRCLCLNVSLGGSEYFDHVDNSNYNMFILFSFDGNKWWYSLRSKTVNVADIAMKYRGGGHVSAAGFSSNKLLLIPGE